MTGILFLAAALLGAFFLPDYYSRWQDEQLLHKAHMEDRQMTHLPDEKDKPVAEKIRMLTESEYFESVGRYDLAEQKRPLTDPSAAWQEKLGDQVEEWIRFGLLPEEFGDLFESSELKLMDLYTCQESGLNILWMRYEKGQSLLDFIMDEDGVCLYYVSYSIYQAVLDRNKEEKNLEDRIRDEGWKRMTLAERAEQESSFQLKEYCQADYVQKAGNGEPLYDGSAGGNTGSVFLFYEDFSVEAASFCLQMNNWEGPYDGYAILLGGSRLMEVVQISNLRSGFDMEFFTMRDPWANGADVTG